MELFHMNYCHNNYISHIVKIRRGYCRLMIYIGFTFGLNWLVESDVSRMKKLNTSRVI